MSLQIEVQFHSGMSLQFCAGMSLQFRANSGRSLQFWVKNPLTPLMLPKDKTLSSKLFRTVFCKISTIAPHLAQLELCWRRLAELKWRLWTKIQIYEIRVKVVGQWPGKVAKG